MLSIRAAALSDIGRVRRENEDRFLLDEAGLAFGVADGVGGLPGGAEAAQQAIEEIARGLRDAGKAEPRIVAIVHEANRSVGLLGQQISPAMGIGTTLTVSFVRGTTLTLAHVGDSRAYVTEAGHITRLTEDHSVENEARLRRARGEIVYYHEANRNALTRCIGQPTPPEVDVIQRPLAAGERYLFCTDGVTRMIPDSELCTLITRAADPRVAVEEIVNLAVRRGGPDNATGVVFFVDSV